MTRFKAISAVTAAVAVAHRRSGESTITVEYRRPRSENPLEQSYQVRVDARTTIGELADSVAVTMAPLAELESGDVTWWPAETSGQEAAGPASPIVTVADGDDLAGLKIGVPVPHRDDRTRWLEQLEMTVRTLDSSPGTTLSSLQLVSTEEIGAVREFGGTGSTPTAERTIPELFREQASRQPEAAAVSCGDLSLTYRELDQLSDQVAHAILRTGAGSQSVVGVRCRPSTELIAILVGIVKAGCSYLAIEPSDPPARVSQVLRLAGAAVVVSGPGEFDVLPNQEGLLLLDLASLPPVDATAPELPHVTPDHVAYVSFTSGSTGVPKGVAVAHRGIVRLLIRPNWMTIGPADTFLHLSPIAFDASTIEIWGPLLNGGRLVIYPNRPVDLADLAETIIRNGISVLLLTTGLLHQMITSHVEAFQRVRHVLTGGEVASAVRVRELMTAWPQLLFTNGYGPTENTSYSTCWTSGEAPLGNTVPIGTPIDGTRIQVLDSALRFVPPGVDGELYLSGQGLAHGYLGVPATTAERFVADPYAEEPGSRMYRTGDLVRWASDGNLEFVGRVDRQLKVRGFRVEPAQIEEELLRSGLIRSAAVVPQPESNGQYRLLAYVVPAETDQAPVAEQLRHHLAGRLPSYMLPWAIIVRDSLPLNRNGKVDRNALPTRHRSPRALATEYTGPRSARERELASLWGDVLEVEPIGVHDSFFDLGGYSLLAAELLSRMKNQAGLEATAGQLYSHPTIAQIVDQVDPPN
ncbi:non-ribosomal peptide synthetase [Kribbella sp. NPDC051718]|uniref:non-ribosomal peptide synthetase n=1 Tax=Kribbella sp. NPDC051718 TaxID=3155168 RepID=UPI003417FE03